MRKRIYLDYAASTPVDPEVERAMRPYFSRKYGNAGSLHSFGQEAVAAVDYARETIANAIGAKFREIIFTGSATEANNLAIRGVAKNFRIRGLDGEKPRIIVSAIEHESVLETARDLELEGFAVVVIPVGRDGVVDLKKLEGSLDKRTILVSIMYANNEIGTIQPIAQIAKIIKDFRGTQAFPLLHIDAAQAFQFLDCDASALGPDLMTFSAHKIYGPKGIGALYIRGAREERYLAPLITGGGQEFGFRSGTENVPLVVGFGKAVELVTKNRTKEAKRISGLRDAFWKGLKSIYPKAQLNGIMNNELRIKDGKNKPIIHTSKFRLPSILNVYFPNYDSQDLLTRFDLQGIAASAGSACAARSAEPSYVIEVLGYHKERARKSIRFSFGRPTTIEDIHRVLEIMKRIL